MDMLLQFWVLKIGCALQTKSIDSCSPPEEIKNLNVFHLLQLHGSSYILTASLRLHLKLFLDFPKSQCCCPFSLDYSLGFLSAEDGYIYHIELILFLKTFIALILQ